VRTVRYSGFIRSKILLHFKGWFPANRRYPAESVQGKLPAVSLPVLKENTCKN
jgi:hypothetical protein